MKVSNIILRVTDLNRARAFYEGPLGLTLKFAFPGFAFFDGGGVQIALNQNEELPGQTTPSAAAGLGVLAYTEVVFEVDDIRATHSLLKSKGVVFVRDPGVVNSDGQRNLLAAPFRDPDGHVLSITGWEPVAASSNR